MKATQQRSTTRSVRLDGQTFVVTGKLMLMTHMEACDVIRSKGGWTEEDVSAGTDYVVVGSDPGQAQMEEAHRFGTPLLSETEFLRLLGAR